uniref:hypothetical protein n=1 Tax=Pandoraea pnomenusa TaxID=93220 RepID=UPI0004081EBD|nr:hypothetical protein [Pandoraea pnomenusa]
MISAPKNSSGHRSVFKKPDPNKSDSLIACTNTANLYFNNGEPSVKDRLQRTDSRKLNPGFYSLSIGPNADSPRVAKMLIDNIQNFLGNNTDCKSIKVKFHSFNNDSLSRLRDIERAVVDGFPGIEIRYERKLIDNGSMKMKRFSNNMIRHVGELNNKRNLMYEAEFYSSFSDGKNTGTADRFLVEKEALLDKYRADIGRAVVGIKFDIVAQRKEYAYQGDDCCRALEKLVACDPLLLDCTIFVYLCIALSMRDELGNLGFNALVSKERGGKLSLNAIGMRGLLADFGFKIEGRPEGELTKGNMVFIRSVNAAPFHPASVMNSHNLICIGRDASEDRQPLLLGFGKEPPLSLRQWQERMSSIAQENLTYADLQLLQYLSNQNTVPVGSSISYRAAWEEIVKLNGKELIRSEMASLGESNMRTRYRTSNVKTPKHFISQELRVNAFEIA